VIGVVSQGAEVIADGNIHVYGPLRGKAMAGARGDTSARIFTTQLDPELLAIAGVYRVIETQLDDKLHNKPTIVQLDGDVLRITARGNCPPVSFVAKQCIETRHFGRCSGGYALRLRDLQNL